MKMLQSPIASAVSHDKLSSFHDPPEEQMRTYCDMSQAIEYHLFSIVRWAPNAPAHRARPPRVLSALAESPAGRAAVARGDTHPGLLGCELQR